VTAQILDFPQKEEEEDDGPWFSGRAKCMFCQHIWEALAPSGARYLECPSCGLLKGAWYAPFAPDLGQYLFRCNCGGEFFVLTPQAIMCANCASLVSRDDCGHDPPAA
jgi:hypothetical protein